MLSYNKLFPFEKNWHSVAVMMAKIIAIGSEKLLASPVPSDTSES